MCREKIEKDSHNYLELVVQNNKESTMEIYVDADACPVKDEILKVASRHNLMTHIVSNSWMRLDNSPLINRVIVDQGPDEADNWIAENITDQDVAVTADIPLAARCLEKEAHAINPDGRLFTEESIGMALAMRDLNSHLREIGETSGQIKPFSKSDRSKFLMTLEEVIQSIKRKQ
ncbi:MAG: YaiI/YqxD family protein [Methyloligellaceae bacterium]